MMKLENLETTSTTFEYSTNETTVTINGKKLSKEEVEKLKPTLDGAMSKVSEALSDVTKATEKMGGIMDDLGETIQKTKHGKQSKA
jgi:hypothetical protein